MIRVRVAGFEGVQQALADAEPKLRRRVLRRVLRRAGNLVRNRARALVPRGATGLLARSIRVVQRRPEDGIEKVSVGVFPPRGRAGRKAQQQVAFYAPFVERGHRVVPRRGKGVGPGIAARRRAARAKLADGQLVSRRFVAGRPFLAPALEQVADEVIAQIARELREGLGGALA